MKGWLRAAQGEAIRNLVLLPAWAVLTATLLWTHGSEWGAYWNGLGRFLRDMTIILGPGCLLIGVWCGGRAHRASADELLAATPRSQLARSSAHIASLALLAYAGILTGAATAGVAIVIIGGYGTPVVVWYVLGVLPTVLGYTGLGYAIGTVLPWRITAPLAGVVAYLTIGFVIYGSDPVTAAVGAGYLGGTETSAFSTTVLLLSALALLALAVIGLALSSVERRPAAIRTWAPIGLVAALVAVPSFAAAAEAFPALNFPQVARPPVVCTDDSGPRVCVLAQDRPILADAARQARAVINRFEGLPGAPTWAGVDAGAHPDPRMLPMSSSPLSPSGKFDPTFSSDLPIPHSYLSPQRYCPQRQPTDGRGTINDHADIASMWLAGEPLPDPSVLHDYPEVAQRFVRASTHQRAAYVSSLALAARSCSLPRILATDALLPELSSQ